MKKLVLFVLIAFPTGLMASVESLPLPPGCLLLPPGTERKVEPEPENKTSLLEKTDVRAANKAIAENIALVMIITDTPSKFTTVEKALVLVRPISYKSINKESVIIYFPDGHGGLENGIVYDMMNDSAIQRLIDQGMQPQPVQLFKESQPKMMQMQRTMQRSSGAACSS